eukprot:CAMPEP_0197036068 /NCGR_PEP_ID=MMETSP1384-20130603/13679_1 /TAXON_ID=29189 /ORGANISM="Ammonia sp." /LENGTH=292 /DNA_ID=CAMNT_0042466201 /DNA_START=217 /DNA_END=1095 /DNA_ORIENTATION=-
MTWILGGLAVLFRPDLLTDSILTMLVIVQISTSSLVSLCMYLFLMLQLYHIFQGTAYAASKYKYIFAHGTNIAFICFSISLLIMDSDTFFADIYLVLISIGFAELLYTLHYNLYLMVLHQRQTIVDNESHFHSTSKATHEHKLTQIRKHGILAFFIVFANLCLIISSLVAIYLRHMSVHQALQNVCYVVYVIVVCLCVNGGPLCMYLALDGNAKLYQNVCACFDVRLQTACNVIAQNRLNRQDSSVRMQEFDTFGAEPMVEDDEDDGTFADKERISVHLAVDSEAQYPSLYV